MYIFHWNANFDDRLLDSDSKEKLRPDSDKITSVDVGVKLKRFEFEVLGSWNWK